MECLPFEINLHQFYRVQPCISIIDSSSSYYSSKFYKKNKDKYIAAISLVKKMDKTTSDINDTLENKDLLWKGKIRHDTLNNVYVSYVEFFSERKKYFAILMSKDIYNNKNEVFSLHFTISSKKYFDDKIKNQLLKSFEESYITY